jgi:hypothetical protein
MASGEELLLAFSACCNAELRFLVEDHGASHEAGFYTFGEQPPALHPGVIPVSGPFFFIERFRLPKVTLDLEFGDRESIVEAKLYYRGAGLCIAPWEFSDAGVVKDPGGLAGSGWVLKTDFMREVIAAMAAGLRENWATFAAPGAGVLARVEARRRERAMADRQAESRREMERAVTMASGLFHLGKHEEVERLLQEFAEDPRLPPSARKMLEIARRRGDRPYGS